MELVRSYHWHLASHNVAFTNFFSTREWDVREGGAAVSQAGGHRGERDFELSEP